MRIADAPPGTEVTLRGAVVPGADQVTSPGGVECVYWETVGDGRREGERFWIADDSGRALVDPLEAEIAARAELRDRVIRLADAELGEIEERIRAIKDERKVVAGPRASELGTEHRRLKKLATLLCAIRARARDNVHVGGTLEGQDRYIRERSPQFSGDGSELLRLADSPEITLREGDTVEVSGLAAIEPIPPGLFAGGYRDLPTCVHVRAPAGGELVIRGIGEAAPRPLPVASPAKPPATTGDTGGFGLAWLLAAAGVLWALLEIFGG